MWLKGALACRPWMQDNTGSRCWMRVARGNSREMGRRPIGWCRRVVLLTGVWLVSLPSSPAAALNLAIDRSEFDFGLLQLDEVRRDVPPEGLRLTCTTDGLNSWQLLVTQLEPMAHEQNPTQVIPETNLRWYGVSTSGSGTLVREESDFTQERAVYTGLGTEGPGGVDVVMKFTLVAPHWTQMGRYRTRLLFTLTE